MKPGDFAGVPTHVILLRRLMVLALALTCLGLGVFAYNQHTALTEAEALIRSLQARTAKLAKASLHTDRPAPSVAEATFPAGVTPVIDPAEAPAEAPLPMSVPMRFPADFTGMMDSPEMQQLMNLRSRGALDSRYAALFKSLGLPADQLKKFQALLLDKQSTMRDVAAAMRSQGFTPNRESADQMRALVQNADEEIDSQIRATLGSTAYSHYQDYERTQPQRATVERVQQRLSYSDEPLSDRQAASLVGILAQNTPAASADAAPRRRLVSGNATAPITEQVVDQARTVLSPVQLTTLQELQQEQAAQTQLARRARDNFPGVRPAAPDGK